MAIYNVTGWDGNNIVDIVQVSAINRDTALSMGTRLLRGHRLGAIMNRFTAQLHK